jgi:hypothetical protein
MGLIVQFLAQAFAMQVAKDIGNGIADAAEEADTPETEHRLEVCLEYLDKLVGNVPKREPSRSVSGEINTDTKDLDEDEDDVVVRTHE